MAASLKKAGASKGEASIAQVTAVPSTKGKTLVMLGLQCKRYVLKAREGDGNKLFETGIEYPVSTEERAALFKLIDEDGVRLFYDASVIKEQMRARNDKSRRQRAASGDEDARLEIEQERLRRHEVEEIDTGATALRDADGNEVGVAT